MSEKDINRWKDAIQQRPEGPWEMGCGGSFDRTQIKPISDEMLAELAQWLHMGYTPWNGRSMPLSANDRQFMFMLYFSVQGLIARVRDAEKAATNPLAAAVLQQEAGEPVAAARSQFEDWFGPNESLMNTHRRQGWNAAIQSGHATPQVPPPQARVPLTERQVDALLHTKHFDKSYKLHASDKVCIDWYRLGLRDGERAHGIGLETKE